MIPNECGIYYDVPFSDYVQIDAINHSFLWAMENQTPLHARWKQDHPHEETPALRIGRAAHALILEPETFEQRWAVAPEVDRRTKAGKEAWSQFVDGSGDKDVIAAAEFESIQAMAQAIESQRLHKLVRTGRAEVVLIWDDPDTGLRCKGRLDYLHQERGLFVIDFKTTECAAEDAFAYSIQRYGYHSQAFFYASGCDEILGQTPGYTWLVAEKNPPYAVAAYQCQGATLEAGGGLCRRALAKYKRCMESGDWPGYPDDVTPIDMPRWAIEKEQQISMYMM
jgi:hypothetical protein